MIKSDYLTLREAAVQLGIETWRVARLGRYLHLEPDQKLIRMQDVERCREEGTPDDRYAILREFLLDAVRHPASNRNGRPAPCQD